MRKSGDDMMTTIGMISSDTDIKIFIDTNKSLNPFVTKEVYQEFESSTKSKKNYRQSSDLTNTSDNRHSSLTHSQMENSIIDEDYIQQLSVS